MTAASPATDPITRNDAIDSLVLAIEAIRDAMPTTLPATDPHAAFRATIADAPDAEGPKLVYADQLDEWGDLPAAFEWRAQVHRARIAAAPDDMQPRLEFAALCDAYGDCEQSEFLRVGVELANYPLALCDSIYPGCEVNGDYVVRHDHKCPMYSVANRCRALLARHGATWARAWLGDVFPDVSSFFFSANGIIADTDDDGTATLIPSWSWHAGAPADFRVPTMAAWRPHDCSCVRWLNEEAKMHDADCKSCHGTGRLPGLGAALVRAVPCRSVECGDKEPTENREQPDFYWVKYQAVNPQSALPEDLWDSLTGANEMESITFRGYPTAALARAALARVLIAEAWGPAQNIAPARS